MPDNQQDILSKTLLRLESELSSFGAVQNALKSAKDTLTKAEKEWDKLTKEQQQSAIELVKATKNAIETTNTVAFQSKVMTDSLIPLAKAIETINFPLRLDKIDVGVNTQASNLASFQETVAREQRTLYAGIEKNGKSISEASDVLVALAKAIETINFPLRLDKIDMNVATQASTLASFQDAVGRGLRTLFEGIEKNGKSISESLEVMKTSFLAGSKKDNVIIALLAINSLVLIVIAVMFFTKGNFPHG